MALTFVAVDGARGGHGTVREEFYDVTLDASYPTGGEAISADEVGLVQIFSAEVIGQSLVAGTAPTAAYLFQWDYKNLKLQAFTSAASGALATHTHDLRIIGGQAAAGTDTVQGAVGDLIFGKEEAVNAVIAGADQATKGGVVPASAGSVAAAAFSELANATDLSTIILRMRFVGA